MSFVAIGSMASQFTKEKTRATPSTTVGWLRVGTAPARSNEPRTMTLAPVVRPKYAGNSFACTRPNVCLGMFLNIVSPTKNVFQIIVPSQIPNADTWTKAATLAGI